MPRVFPDLSAFFKYVLHLVAVYGVLQFRNLIDCDEAIDKDGNKVEGGIVLARCKPQLQIESLKNVFLYASGGSLLLFVVAFLIKTKDSRKHAVRSASVIYMLLAAALYFMQCNVIQAHLGIRPTAIRSNKVSKRQGPI